MSIFQFLFSPRGRIRRRDFWLYSICIALAYYAVTFFVHRFVFNLPDKAYFFDLAGWITFNPTPFTLVVMSILVLRIWPSLCVLMKRWHDRNRPWWIPVAIYAGSWSAVFVQRSYGFRSPHPSLAVIILLGLVAAGVGIWQFIECGCLDGTKGPNQYGPSPKGIDADPSAVF